MIQEYEKAFLIGYAKDDFPSEWLGIFDPITEKMDDSEHIEMAKALVKAGIDNTKIINDYFGYFGAEVSDVAEAFDIDLDSLSSIESNRDIWGGSDYEDEFEEQIEELKEDEDEDW